MRTTCFTTSDSLKLIFSRASILCYSDRHFLARGRDQPPSKQSLRTLPITHATWRRPCDARLVCRLTYSTMKTDLLWKCNRTLTVSVSHTLTYEIDPIHWSLLHHHNISSHVRHSISRWRTCYRCHGNAARSSIRLATTCTPETIHSWFHSLSAENRLHDVTASLDRRVKRCQWRAGKVRKFNWKRPNYPELFPLPNVTHILRRTCSQSVSCSNVRQQ